MARRKLQHQMQKPLTLLQVIKSEAASNPSMLVCSVFSYDDVLHHLHVFMRTWRALSGSCPGLKVRGN